MGSDKDRLRGVKTRRPLGPEQQPLARSPSSCPRALPPPHCPASGPPRALRPLPETLHPWVLLSSCNSTKSSPPPRGLPRSVWLKQFRVVRGNSIFTVSHLLAINALFPHHAPHPPAVCGHCRVPCSHRRRPRREAAASRSWPLQGTFEALRGAVNGPGQRHAMVSDLPVSRPVSRPAP